MKIIAVAALWFTVGLCSCSLLQKQETTASSIPSAATLTEQCAKGAAQTPSIRAGACDDFNLVQTECIANTMQAVPQGAIINACNAGGYAISGTFTKL